MFDIRGHSGLRLNPWEEALLCNAYSHWLSPYPEWSLVILIIFSSDGIVSSWRMTFVASHDVPGVYYRDPSYPLNFQGSSRWEATRHCHGNPENMSRDHPATQVTISQLITSTLKPEQNGGHLAGDFSKGTVLNILFEIQQKLVHEGLLVKKSALGQEFITSVLFVIVHNSYLKMLGHPWCVSTCLCQGNIRELFPSQTNDLRECHNVPDPDRPRVPYRIVRACETAGRRIAVEFLRQLNTHQLQLASTRNLWYRKAYPQRDWSFSCWVWRSPLTCLHSHCHGNRHDDSAA